MNRSTKTLPTIVFVTILMCSCSNQIKNIPSTSSSAVRMPLRVAISPYQDTSFLVNAGKLGLEKKYGITLKLFTIPWEDILPAVASAGQTVDIGYGNMTEYLTKSINLNRQNDDPVLFIYPLWIVKGTSFITFNKDVPELNNATIEEPALVKKFLSFKIGGPKNTSCQMLLFLLAKKAGIKLSAISFINTTIADGLLAAENGSLDIAGAGVTQRTEAERRHGRVVLTMDAFDVGDIEGFICKKSTLKRRITDIESLIKMQLDCEKYVLSDIDHNSAVTLDYLRKNASTKYTLAEYKRALSYQYFPLSIEEIKKQIIADEGKYSIKQYTKTVNQYLTDIGVIKTDISTPKPIILDQK